VSFLSLLEVFTIKERIISAFLELSQTKGFYRLTMDELSARAGLSKRTLYRYFRSKDEIIEAALDQLLAEVAGKIEELVAACQKPEEVIAEMLNILYYVGRTLNNPLVLEDLRRHYPHYWKKIYEFRLEKAECIIKSKLLQDGRNKAYIRELDPRIVTTAILASVQAVANPEFILNNGLTFDETIRQLMELFQFGFFHKAPDETKL